eukprot:TRINITY_DN42425_c0_g1_i1.p1 TRINITY_DN42425_c0_g1~~TRINITY_DN42425_c0_g1_i1.p1  ORF type:complete len:308 (+),score=76.74 TRINITY_DN42425_c0_g1_i1:39-926(+)
MAKTMHLRRKIAKLLVRDLGKICRGTGSVREMDVQVPCVRQFFGFGVGDRHLVSNWEHFMTVPKVLEKVKKEVRGTTLVVDWARFKDEIVKKLWCGCEAAELAEIEKEAFDMMQWVAEQRVLKEVSRETTENGIKVTAMIGREEAAETDRYLFHYRIDVENQTAKDVRLIARNLNFYDSTHDLNASVVNGLGVVGYTPLIHPGDSFSWHSGCNLPTPTGTMSGSLEFTVEDESSWERHISMQVMSRAMEHRRLELFRDCALETFSTPLPSIDLKAAPVISLQEQTDWVSLFSPKR